MAPLEAYPLSPKALLVPPLVQPEPAPHLYFLILENHVSMIDRWLLVSDRW
jgi:hypothetical protein